MTKATTLRTALCVCVCQRWSAGADATGIARAHGPRKCRYWAPLLCSFTSPLTSPRLRANFRGRKQSVAVVVQICAGCFCFRPHHVIFFVFFLLSFFRFLRHRFGGSPLLWPWCGGPSSSVLLSPGASQVHQGHGGVCCCRFAQQTNNWITGLVVVVVVVVLLWQGRRGLFGLDFVGVCRFLAGV